MPERGRLLTVSIRFCEAWAAVLVPVTLMVVID